MFELYTLSIEMGGNPYAANSPEISSRVTLVTPVWAPLIALIRLTFFCRFLAVASDIRICPGPAPLRDTYWSYQAVRSVSGVDVAVVDHSVDAVTLLADGIP